MYMTYDEHISYGEYVQSKSLIIKHIGQGYYRKQVSSYTNTYDILEMLHSLNFFNLSLLPSSSSCTRSRFKNVFGIRWYNLQEFLQKGNSCKTVNKEIYFNIFRRFRDAVRTKGPQKWRNSSFSFTTMLQHTGRFQSSTSQLRTMSKHWRIFHTLLIWLKLIFTYSLN